MGKRSISVKIFNETYILRTEASEEEVRAVAGLVDEKMQELAEKTGTGSTEKVAVWTALDLAAELYNLRKRYEKILQLAKER